MIVPGNLIYLRSEICSLMHDDLLMIAYADVGIKYFI